MDGPLHRLPILYVYFLSNEKSFMNPSTKCLTRVVFTNFLRTRTSQLKIAQKTRRNSKNQIRQESVA